MTIIISTQSTQPRVMKAAEHIWPDLFNTEYFKNLRTFVGVVQHNAWAIGEKVTSIKGRVKEKEDKLPVTEEHGLCCIQLDHASNFILGMSESQKILRLLASDLKPTKVNAKLPCISISSSSGSIHHHVLLHQPCAVLHSNIQSLDCACCQGRAKGFIKVVSIIPDQGHPGDSGQSHVWKQKNFEPSGSIIFGLVPSTKHAAGSGGAVPRHVTRWQLTAPRHVQSHVRTTRGHYPATASIDFCGQELKDSFPLVLPIQTAPTRRWRHHAPSVTACKGLGVREERLPGGTQGRELSPPFKASDAQERTGCRERERAS